MTVAPPPVALRPAPTPIGTRYVRRRGPDGADHTDMVPLYETDLLTPQEGDQVVNNPLHAQNLFYLYAALLYLTRERPGVRVFADRRVDFRVPGMRPLGPDLLVVTDSTGPDDLRSATFRFGVSGGRPLLALELTSDSTRVTDVGPKFDLYHRAGVQHFVLGDLPSRADRLEFDGYRWTEQGYQRMGWDPDGTLWLPELGVGFRADGTTAVLVTSDGRPMPDYTTLLSGAEADRLRADAEQHRADAERQRADAEQHRAEAAEARLAELEAELRRLQGGP